METYTIQEAEKRFHEILLEVRSGQAILIVDQEGDIAEIRPLRFRKPESDDEGFQQLVEAGILFPPEAWPALEDQPLSEDSSSEAVEEGLRKLEEEGILSSPGVRPEGELTPIAVVPGALARFLVDRD